MSKRNRNIRLPLKIPISGVLYRSARRSGNFRDLSLLQHSAGVTCSHRSIEQEIALAGNMQKMGLTCKVAALELGMKREEERGKREEGNRQIYYCLTQKRRAIS